MHTRKQPSFRRKHRTASSDLGIDQNLSHKTPNHKKPTYWDFTKIKTLLFNKRQESEKLSHQLGKGFTVCVLRQGLEPRICENIDQAVTKWQLASQNMRAKDTTGRQLTTLPTAKAHTQAARAITPLWSKRDRCGCETDGRQGPPRPLRPRSCCQVGERHGRADMSTHAPWQRPPNDDIRGGGGQPAGNPRLSTPRNSGASMR